MSQRVTVDLIVEENAWDELELEQIAEKACEAGADVVGLTLPCEVSVLATGDQRITALNKEFRGNPSPTNVLSWPSEELSGPPGTDPVAPEDPEIGDIAISYQTCAREAADFGKSVHDHVTHLLLHGFLHLLGYDHVRDEDATVMESLEIKALERLGIENPY